MLIQMFIFIIIHKVVYLPTFETIVTFASEKLSNKESLRAPGNFTYFMDMMFPNRVKVARHSIFCFIL